jgi:hypothetical protein
MHAPLVFRTGSVQARAQAQPTAERVPPALGKYYRVGAGRRCRRKRSAIEWEQRDIFRAPTGRPNPFRDQVARRRRFCPFPLRLRRYRHFVSTSPAVPFCSRPPSDMSPSSPARLDSALQPLLPEPEKKLSRTQHGFLLYREYPTSPGPTSCLLQGNEQHDTHTLLLAYSESSEGCAAWRPGKATLSCRFPFRRVTATCLSCRPRISGCMHAAMWEDIWPPWSRPAHAIASPSLHADAVLPACPSGVRPALQRIGATPAHQRGPGPVACRISSGKPDSVPHGRYSCAADLDWRRKICCLLVASSRRPALQIT